MQASRLTIGRSCVQLPARRPASGQACSEQTGGNIAVLHANLADQSACVKSAVRPFWLSSSTGCCNLSLRTERSRQKSSLSSM